MLHFGVGPPDRGRNSDSAPHTHLHPHLTGAGPGRRRGMGRTGRAAHCTAHTMSSMTASCFQCLCPFPCPGPARPWARPWTSARAWQRKGPRRTPLAPGKQPGPSHPCQRESTRWTEVGHDSSYFTGIAVAKPVKWYRFLFVSFAEITALSRSQTMELSTPESLASPDSSTSPPSPGDFLDLIRPRTWESLEVQEARAKEALEFREAYQAHKVSEASRSWIVWWRLGFTSWACSLAILTITQKIVFCIS